MLAKGFAITLYMNKKVNNMETKKLLQELHTDNREWLNKLSFYEDEILFFKNQIEQVANKKDDETILALCESYLNRLSIQRDQIHKIRDEVNMQERNIVIAEKTDPVVASKKFYPDEAKEREEMVTFESLYAELKNEIYQFFGKIKR